MFWTKLSFCIDKFTKRSLRDHHFPCIWKKYSWVLLNSIFPSTFCVRQNCETCWTASGIVKSCAEKGHLISSTPVSPSKHTLPSGVAAINGKSGFITNSQSWICPCWNDSRYFLFAEFSFPLSYEVALVEKVLLEDGKMSLKKISFTFFFSFANFPELWCCQTISPFFEPQFTISLAYSLLFSFLCILQRVCKHFDYTAILFNYRYVFYFFCKYCVPTFPCINLTRMILEILKLK